jgi:hypothetical protein
MVEILIKLPFEDCWGMPRDSSCFEGPEATRLQRIFWLGHLNILCLKSFPSWWFTLSMALVQFLKLSKLKNLLCHTRWNLVKPKYQTPKSSSILKLWKKLFMVNFVISCPLTIFFCMELTHYFNGVYEMSPPPSHAIAKD